MRKNAASSKYSLNAVYFDPMRRKPRMQKTPLCRGVFAVYFRNRRRSFPLLFLR